MRKAFRLKAEATSIQPEPPIFNRKLRHSTGSSGIQLEAPRIQELQAGRHRENSWLPPSAGRPEIKMAIATAQNVGKVVQIIGPVVDVEFEGGHLPEIYHAIRISSDGRDGGQNLDVIPQ